MGSDGTKRFRVPDEDIAISDLEVEVIQTRQFQRLFDLQQLGLARLVYPAASHTRGAHSIQCLAEVQRIIAWLKPTGSDPAVLRMAALLHDIGHVPYSHSLEDEATVLPKHDRAQRIQAAIAMVQSENLSPEAAALVSEAVPIIIGISQAHDTEKLTLRNGIVSEVESTDWRSDLIGNTVCADLLAYIRTDAATTGIEKRPGYYRIYEYFTLHEDRFCIQLTKGGLRTDIVSAILDLLDMRYALTERVYFHHAKAIASAMLARVVQLVGLPTESELLALGDQTFLDRLESRASTASDPGPSRLIKSLRSRRLHKRIFRVSRDGRQTYDSGRSGAFCARWRDPAQVAQLLEEVESQHKLPQGALSLWCPDAHAGMKLAKAKVLWHTDGAVDGPAELRSDVVRQLFPGVHRRVKQIEDQYEDLWNLWIGIDADYFSSAPDIVEQLADDLDVRCDQDFFTTYLMRDPAFAKRWRRVRRVAKVTGPVIASVNRIVEDQAAATGADAASLDSGQILDSLITEASAAAGGRGASVQQSLGVEDLAREGGTPTQPPGRRRGSASEKQPDADA